MAGLVMQLITQNKMAEPTTTGTIEWAGLGLIFVYLIFPAPSLVVPIIGMMLGAVISAISTYISLAFNMSQSIESWFVGSFSNIQIGRYEYLWLILIITFFIFIYADRLTVAGLGEDIATSLGVNYSKIIILSTVLISLTVGIVVSVIGSLPFLGLIIPNLISIFRGDNLKTNLHWVCVIGMGIVTACDIIARTIIMPFEVPVSLILGILGSIVFIIILLRQYRTKDKGDIMKTNNIDISSNQRVTRAFRSKKELKIYWILLVTFIVLGVFFTLGLLLHKNPVPMNSPSFIPIIKRRSTAIIAMLIAAICQCLATIAFQSSTNNRIITPSLLGFDALYTTIHTSTMFFFVFRHS